MPPSPRLPRDPRSSRSPGAKGARPAGMPTGRPVSLPPRGQGQTLGDPELMQALGAVREQLAQVPKQRRDDARDILTEAAQRLIALSTT